MNSFLQLKDWYFQHLPLALKQRLKQEPFPLMLEDATPGDFNPENYAWLRRRRYALAANSHDRSFNRAGWLEIWEKSRLFSLKDLERVTPALQQELASYMILNAAIDCDDPKARVVAALAFSPGPYTLPLIRKLFRDLKEEEKEFVLHQIRDTICDERHTDAALRLYLETWADNPGGSMDSRTLNKLLDRCLASENLMRALLQCAGENHHDRDLLINWFQETDFGFISPRLQQVMMDYCGLQATRDTLELLLSWELDLKARRSVENWIPQYLALTIDDCRRRMDLKRDQRKPSTLPLPEKNGFTLAQFMFYGDLMLPGKANSGGITTLLRTLGDTLAEQTGVKHVYTFMMIPCDERAGNSDLTTSLTPGHTLVRVPVFFDEACSPELFQEKEYDIGHTLDRMLHLLQVQPDIFHMRYADNASLAAALLAKKWGKKAVFTLTPDPHRNIKLSSEIALEPESNQGQKYKEDFEKQIMQLNKVRAADDILQVCDGVLGIGTPELTSQLTAYFPPLNDSSKKAGLVFQMIPEGIRFETSQEGKESGDPWTLFSTPNGKYRLHHHRKHLPVIMTVGRLDPVKGLMTLLEAWSDSPLWQAYNLVVIGGDLQRPDKKEKSLLGQIHRFMEAYPHLKGAFCHLGRMDNLSLRQLQQCLAQQWWGDHPNLYIAPSVKEEFGLSIIEAMAAGLVVVGPRAGGVGSYLTSGENGFLVETKNPASLREDLVALLLENNRTRDEWLAIAAKGKTTVEERFDIQKVAFEFAHFYQRVLTAEVPSPGPRILFLIPPFYSHFNPMITLAKGFSREGWGTLVGTGEAFKEQVEAASLMYEKVVISQNANTGIAGKTHQAQEEQNRLEAFFQATHQGPEETLLIQSQHRRKDMLSDPEGLMKQIRILDHKHHPDLWVVDQLSYGATLALCCLGLPFITFCPPHPFSIPGEEGLFGVPQRWPSDFQPNPVKMAVLERTATDVRDDFTDFFNEALQRYGHPPVKNAFSLTSPLAVIYNYPPTDLTTAQQSQRQEKAVYAGYCFEPQPLTPAWEKKLTAFREGTPRLLISFGTFLSRRVDLIEKCIGWIREAYPESRMVVAAGDSAEALRHVKGEKVLVEGFVPQTALYPEVDLVIHHGGNNTFTESLYHGKPMILFPFSSDQFHIGAEAEAMGVARVLVPNEVTKEKLIQGVKRMLARQTMENTGYWQGVVRQRGPLSAVREVIRCWERGNWA